MWINLYNENKNGDGFVFLVGNKIDLEYREVQKKQGERKAETLNIPYFQMSAKTGENIEDLFFKLVEYTQQKPVNHGYSANSNQKDVIKEEGAEKEEELKADETVIKLDAG